MVKIAVLGCGNVGASLLRLIDQENETISYRTGIKLEVVKVVVRDISKIRPSYINKDLLTNDAIKVVQDPDIDIIVELIGGIEPARELIIQALKAKKAVVSANKELLATYGDELLSIEAQTGSRLLYEASVAGGVPVIRTLRQSLVGEKIIRVMGIINGTTNYILTKMTESGTNYEGALLEAQQLGYAESDPTSDVEGKDAAFKAAIIATLAFGQRVSPNQVFTQGISSITSDDIAFATRLGYVIKLLAVVERIESTSLGSAQVAVRVHPAMIDKSHPLASVREEFNAVFIEGEAVGELMLYGRGAGGSPTASAVLGDIIDAAKTLNSPADAYVPELVDANILEMGELKSQYYLNIDVADRPGVLSMVAEVFGQQGVSIRSMEQIGLGDEARLVFITHVAKEKSMQKTIELLRNIDAIDRVGALLRVMGSKEEDNGKCEDNGK